MTYSQLQPVLNQPLNPKKPKLKEIILLSLLRNDQECCYPL